MTGYIGPAVRQGGADAVLEFLDHEAAKVRLEALNVLDWDQKVPGRAEHLLPLLDDPDEAVRVQALSTGCGDAAPAARRSR